jgi:hypothetical protein
MVAEKVDFTLAEILANIHALVDSIPAAPIFASASIFSDESLMRWIDGPQEFLIAGSGFWLRFQKKSATEFGQIGQIGLYDLDNPTNRDMRERVYESLTRTMGQAVSGGRR